VLQLKNTTGFAATFFLSPDPDGIDTLYAIVKGSFDLPRVATDRAPAPSRVQRPIAAAAQYHDDPLTSSARVPSDVGLQKPGTDVLLVGSAHAPRGAPTHAMTVSLAVGPVRKAVRVIGDRWWVDTPLGARISEPEPFTRMPLAWERAFGGSDRSIDDELLEEARNPVGTGLRHPRSARPLRGLALPNLEDPAAPVRGTSPGPVPAGLGPIPEHWRPRRDHAGTYDDHWRRTRAPYLPTDFNTRFFHLAPADQIVAGGMTGGEVVEAIGVTPSGHLRCTLPRLAVEVGVAFGDTIERRTAMLDTVFLAPDDGVLTLTWRAAVRCDRRALAVTEIVVAAESGDSARAA
jgi:hypothetical protein